ncbi:uncharacterized protein MONBRDRAFT_34594 [Monosiga brevicollis MX1]|uniref:Tyrosinase copper-binding domain-containing protein n=1 Tax=Monosiga brevicollis TaxID=81824 RepID=A9VCQ6_MONBE|nr:uncharacterized protein MONBRDRAFT_34594 [Monosiga brevicollis MX1]EDQ84727.1 predicted protein [Monosiga brevicollis MX1]|eukprot:XP_001750513.1 hypothetical protein [Monosiga brevicollis MX1]
MGALVSTAAHPKPQAASGLQRVASSQKVAEADVAELLQHDYGVEGDAATADAVAQFVDGLGSAVVKTGPWTKNVVHLTQLAVRVTEQAGGLDSAASSARPTPRERSALLRQLTAALTLLRHLLRFLVSTVSEQALLAHVGLPVVVAVAQLEPATYRMEYVLAIYRPPQQETDLSTAMEQGLRSPVPKVLKNKAFADPSRPQSPLVGEQVTPSELLNYSHTLALMKLLAQGLTVDAETHEEQAVLLESVSTMLVLLSRNLHHDFREASISAAVDAWLTLPYEELQQAWVHLAAFLGRANALDAREEEDDLVRDISQLFLMPVALAQQMFGANQAQRERAHLRWQLLQLRAPQLLLILLYYQSGVRAQRGQAFWDVLRNAGPSSHAPSKVLTVFPEAHSHVRRWTLSFEELLTTCLRHLDTVSGAAWLYHWLCYNNQFYTFILDDAQRTSHLVLRLLQGLHGLSLAKFELGRLQLLCLLMLTERVSSCATLQNTLVEEASWYKVHDATTDSVVDLAIGLLSNCLHFNLKTVRDRDFFISGIGILLNLAPYAVQLSNHSSQLLTRLFKLCHRIYFNSRQGQQNLAHLRAAQRCLRAVLSVISATLSHNTRSQVSLVYCLLTEAKLLGQLASHAHLGRPLSNLNTLLRVFEALLQHDRGASVSHWTSAIRAELARWPADRFPECQAQNLAENSQIASINLGINVALSDGAFQNESPKYRINSKGAARREHHCPVWRSTYFTTPMTLKNNFLDTLPSPYALEGSTPGPCPYLVAPAAREIGNVLMGRVMDPDTYPLSIPPITQNYPQSLQKVTCDSENRYDKPRAIDCNRNTMALFECDRYMIALHKLQTSDDPNHGRVAYRRLLGMHGGGFGTKADQEQIEVWKNNNLDKAHRPLMKVKADLDAAQAEAAAPLFPEGKSTATLDQHDTMTSWPDPQPNVTPRKIEADAPESYLTHEFCWHGWTPFFWWHRPLMAEFEWLLQENDPMDKGHNNFDALGAHYLDWDNWDGLALPPYLSNPQYIVRSDKFADKGFPQHMAFPNPLYRWFAPVHAEDQLHEKFPGQYPDDFNCTTRDPAYRSQAYGYTESWPVLYTPADPSKKTKATNSIRDMVHDAMLNPNLEEFATTAAGGSGSMEQPHNLFHNRLGGSYGDGSFTGTMTSLQSIYDPIFWLHHSNIERQLMSWQRAWVPENKPGFTPLPESLPDEATKAYRIYPWTKPNLVFPTNGEAPQFSWSTPADVDGEGNAAASTTNDGTIGDWWAYSTLPYEYDNYLIPEGDPRGERLGAFTVGSPRRMRLDANIGKQPSGRYGLETGDGVLVDTVAIQNAFAGGARCARCQGKKGQHLAFDVTGTFGPEDLEALEKWRKAGKPKRRVPALARARIVRVFAGDRRVVVADGDVAIESVDFWANRGLRNPAAKLTLNQKQQVNVMLKTLPVAQLTSAVGSASATTMGVSGPRPMVATTANPTFEAALAANGMSSTVDFDPALWTVGMCHGSVHDFTAERFTVRLYDQAGLQPANAWMSQLAVTVSDLNSDNLAIAEPDELANVLVVVTEIDGPGNPWILTSHHRPNAPHPAFQKVQPPFELAKVVAADSVWIYVSPAVPEERRQAVLTHALEGHVLSPHPHTLNEGLLEPTPSSDPDEPGESGQTASKRSPQASRRHKRSTQASGGPPPKVVKGL